MGSPERDAINRAYQETMTILLTVAVCIAAPLIPLSLCMGNYKLDQVCLYPLTLNSARAREVVNAFVGIIRC